MQWAGYMLNGHPASSRRNLTRALRTDWARSALPLPQGRPGPAREAAAGGGRSGRHAGWEQCLRGPPPRRHHPPHLQLIGPDLWHLRSLQRKLPPNRPMDCRPQWTAQGGPALCLHYAWHLLRVRSSNAQHHEAHHLGVGTCPSPTSSIPTYHYFIHNWLQLCFLVSRGSTEPSNPNHQGLLHYIWGGVLQVPAFPLIVLTRAYYTTPRWTTRLSIPLCSHQVLPHYNWGDYKVQHSSLSSPGPATLQL